MLTKRDTWKIFRRHKSYWERKRKRGLKEQRFIFTLFCFCKIYESIFSCKFFFFFFWGGEKQNLVHAKLVNTVLNVCTLKCVLCLYSCKYSEKYKRYRKNDYKKIYWSRNVAIELDVGYTTTKKVILCFFIFSLGVSLNSAPLCRVGSSSDCTFFCCLSFHYFCIPPPHCALIGEPVVLTALLMNPYKSACPPTSSFLKLWLPFSFTLEFFFYNHNNLEVWLLKREKKKKHYMSDF